MRRRLGSALLVGLLALLVHAGGALAQDATPELVIRESTFSEDGAVRLVVSVTGATLARNLTADDVTISEAGESVGDLTVAPLGGEQADPIGVALLVDVSGSTEGEPLAAAKEAAAAFVTGLASTDARVTLISFSGEVTLNLALTSDLDAVRGALDLLAAGGDTALYDAVVLAASELGRAQVQRNIVVFSDGADTASETTLDAAVTAATAVGAPVTTVILSSPELDAGSLEQLAGSTSGRALTVASAADLSSAFEQVASELASQFVIEYTGDITDVRDLDVTIAIDADGIAASRTFTVVNPRREAVPVIPPEVLGRTSAGLLASPLLLLLGLLAAFGASALILGTIVLTPRTKAARLLDRELAAYVEGSGRKTSPAVVAEALRERAGALLESAPGAAQLRSDLQRRIDQAGLPLRSGELIGIALGLSALLALIGGIFAGLRGVLVLFLPGLIVPFLYVSLKRSQRLSRFLELLPDTLQLMSGSLSAGYGVLQAIDLVTKESVEPMKSEFQRVLVEARLGMPLEESLENMAQRMDSDDFRWVVLAMNIQREVGGNLAQLMQTVATTLRSREALRRHISALSAEGKLSAIILIALPFLLAGYLILVNPGYVSTLTESFMGWVLIAGGGLGIVIGMVWIRALIRAIEV